MPSPALDWSRALPWDGPGAPVYRGTKLAAAPSTAPDPSPGRAPLERPELAQLSGLPNLVTLAGLGCALVWLGGGHWIWAFLSIVADEADGSLARAMGDTTEFGASLDRTIDLVLTGAVAMRLGPMGLAALGPIVLIQAATDGDKIEFGSMRAALMAIAVMSGK